MKRVRATKLSEESALQDLLRERDFLDCYTVGSSLTPRRAAEIITTFPGWARALVLLRRIVTTPFGLSNDGPSAPDKLGPFPVESETERELIAGFNDKHLDFRVSVFATGETVSLATWVHPHNLGGRLYLATIIPFHIAIARNALARVARAG